MDEERKTPAEYAAEHRYYAAKIARGEYDHLIGTAEIVAWCEQDWPLKSLLQMSRGEARMWLRKQAGVVLEDAPKGAPIPRVHTQQRTLPLKWEPRRSAPPRIAPVVTPVAPSVEPVMPWGKFEGKRMGELTDKYLHWLAEHTWLEEPLKKAAVRELQARRGR